MIDPSMNVAPMTRNSSPPMTAWNALSQADRDEFVRLRVWYLQSQRVPPGERRTMKFANELFMAIQWVERSTDHVEERALVAGICCVGPIICINTRQLKPLISRCKSSINGLLHELGYISVWTKTKVRLCLIQALPSIWGNPEQLRQWTIRHASQTTTFCFVSRFACGELPVIGEDDLNERPQAKRRLDVESFSVPAAFRVESLLS
jgi:hypothetical protein